MALDTLVSYNNFVHPCSLTTKMTVYIFMCVCGVNSALLQLAMAWIQITQCARQALQHDIVCLLACDFQTSCLE
jgi:hypothetical protein